MRLRVAVSWVNARTPLLPEAGADIRLAADARELAPVSVSYGIRVFEVPDGTSQLKLRASFTAFFPATAKVPPQRAEVLHIEQAYRVEHGTQLVPDPIGAFGGPHPLALLKGVAGKTGAAVIALRTEFVDITPFWQVYGAYWDYYLAEHRPGTKLIPLGYTGGSPIVWFASVPDWCATSSDAAVSTLVFFRPNNYTYSALNDDAHTMAALSRYLCEPKADTDTAARGWERDHIEAPPDGSNLIRCGFENALVESLRAVVMLHPWPSGMDYGVAQTALLPQLCESVVRYLWARQLLCRDVGNVRLGRLGLSGYSRGGLALWPALSANMRRVEELYAFDCNMTAENAGAVVQWYPSVAKDPKLRMVGGAYNVTVHNAIAKTIADLDGIRGQRANLTLALRDPKWFASNTQSYWEHVIGKRPELRRDMDTQHQFAIFGGRYLGTDLETFLSNFLKASGFNRR